MQKKKPNKVIKFIGEKKYITRSKNYAFNKLLTNREINQMENDAYWKVVPIMTTKY